MDTPRILGFSAHKQGGKTTAIQAVLQNLPHYPFRGDTGPVTKVLSFAQPLKDIVQICFVPPGQNLNMDREEDKNTVLPCGKTVRQMLQLIGTDWFRHTWPDVWINAFMKSVQTSQCNNLLIPDVRFPNELSAIQDMGGHVIRFLRTPFLEDQHESETALDGNEYASIPGHEGYRDAFHLRPFDAIIDNRQMSIEQQNGAVLNVVRENHWLEGCR